MYGCNFHPLYIILWDNPHKVKAYYVFSALLLNDEWEAMGPWKPESCVVKEMMEWATQRGREHGRPGWKTAKGASGMRSVIHFNC